jgi:class 3 adenylate cyclase/predicted ATPase
MNRLKQWLEVIGLGQYSDLLAENNIDWDILPDLSEQDFEKIGISLGHRKKLLKAIAEYRSNAPRISEPLNEVRPVTGVGNAKAGRRQLTVAFCDVVGSTALSSQLDPEDLRKILHAFQSCCGSAIRRYGGHVARFMGDGVLAYFGFPTAHEDDAERAVNAALQIVASVSALAIPMAGRLQIRIGIATGLVVVGDLIGEGPSQEFAAVGEAPNLAARLQQLAEPNQILVAPLTRRLLGKLFEFADLGDHRIRGLERRVRVWSVLRASSVATRFEARQSSQLTPLVGREKELVLLETRYRKVKRGKGQVITISGEPGIGKSRLVTAVRSRLSGKMHCPSSIQCSSYHTNTAWHPIIRYLEEIAEIARDTPHMLRLDKLVGLVERYLANKAGAIVPYLAALLSIPTGDRYAPLELTPQQQKNRTFAALLTLLKAQASQQPLLLVFEDVHWIDPTSWELLERLRDQVRGWQMLVILLFRPEFELPWNDEQHITSLTINRLPSAQVVSMIESLAEDRPLSPTIVQQIVAKTDGVPLFVEEMTKAVLESRTPTEEQAELYSEPAFEVPDTLHDSLMARLDQSAPMKTVAQIAAAIGREFSLDLLNAIVPLSELNVQAAINHLLASGLLLQSGQSSSQTYIFKHALVQDEAYASLLRDDRRQLHVKIARVLCERFSEIAEATPELVAHHFTQAHELEPAIAHWLKAGREASKRSAFVEATRHFQIALKLLAGLPATLTRDELELQIQHSLGSAFIAAKGFGADETAEAFKRALELCNKFERSPRIFAVLNGVVGVHLMRGEFEQSRDLAEQLLAHAQRQDESTPRLMGHRALGMSLFVVGELAAARDELHKSLLLYDDTCHSPLALVFSQDFKATAQAYLSLTSVLLGDIKGGLAHGAEALAHAERLRHPHSICYVLPFLAGSYLVAGMPQAASPIAERVIVLSSEYGFPLWSAGGLMLRGWTRLDLGDVEGGLAEIHRSVDELQATGTLIWVQFARFLLAQALAKAGQVHLAMQQVQQILVEIGGTSGRWYEAEVHRLNGQLLADQGAPAAAEVCFERAIAVATRQGARVWQLRATNALSSLWCAQGRRSELRTRLAPLYSSFGNEVTGVDLQRAKVLLTAIE